jgi:hypothetical protein
MDNAATAEKHNQNEMLAVVDPIYKLASRVISILTIIVFLAVLAFLILLGAYIYALVKMDPAAGGRADALVNLERVMFTMWDKLVPIGAAVLKVVAPVLIILLALLLLRTLARVGATPFDLGKVTSDLPSTLALVIVITICLLPLAGLGIPDVLNNIALVVVGFYFGKRETRDEGTTVGSRGETA